MSNQPKNASYWKRQANLKDCQLQDAVEILKVVLRYADYGTAPAQDDLAITEARAFLADLKR